MFNTEKHNENIKRKVVLFSGGFDSTYVLAKLVAEASSDSIISAVTIDHNITGTQKLRREYESQLLILRELRKRFPNINIEHEIIKIESNWTCGDSDNSRGLAQPIFWLCNLIPFLHDNDCIYIGYNQYDQATSYLSSIDMLLSSACSIQNNKKIDILYPLLYNSKSDVLKMLIMDFPYLVDLCVSCESMIYGDGKLCGNCVPCMHIKEALVSLVVADIYDVSDKAESMLNDMFNLSVKISYESHSDTNENDEYHNIAGKTCDDVEVGESNDYKVEC